jgi:hypothetical protein
MLATIVVNRTSAPWRDRKRAYKLLVDGHVAGEVRDSQEVRHTVTPGTHTVAMKIDWSGSDTLSVTLGSGETAWFVCEPASSSAMALRDLLSRRAWVSLREDPDR